MTYDAYGDDAVAGPATRETDAAMLNNPKATLRDEFAMAALSAAMGREDCPSATPLAVAVYRIADAMMEARK